MIPPGPPNAFASTTSSAPVASTATPTGSSRNPADVTVSCELPVTWNTVPSPPYQS